MPQTLPHAMRRWYKQCVGLERCQLTPQQFSETHHFLQDMEHTDMRLMCETRKQELANTNTDTNSNTNMCAVRARTTHARAHHNYEYA